MGINGVNQQNYNYYNRGVNNNFTLTNSYANATIFTGNNQTIIGDSYNNNQTVVPKDGKDDGSIGFFGAIGNLFKGVGNFFKEMVCDENGKFSIVRTLTTLGIGAVIGVACTMLPAITIAGTAFSTLGLISAGFLGFAGLHAGKSAIDILSANTDAEAEQAWQSMGSALTEGGLAYLGYRASGGIFAKDVVPTTPSGSTLKTSKTPKSEPTLKTETPTPKTPKSEPTAEGSVVEKSGILGRTDGLKLENVPKEYIGPKEFNPAEYATADNIPGMRFGESNVNIKQYNSEGLSIRMINADDQVHVSMVTDFKPGTSEIVKQSSYRPDGKTLKSLREYAKGKVSKTTYYKEDGKTIDSIFDSVTNTKYKYNYKEDGVTIDSVLVCKNKSILPSSVIKYENGKPGKELPCDIFGKPIEEAPVEVAQPKIEIQPKVDAEVDATMPYNNIQHLSRVERLAYYDKKYSIHKNNSEIKNSVPTHGYLNSMNPSIRFAIRNKENNSGMQYEKVLENVDVFDSFFGELTPTEYEVVGFRGRAYQGKKSSDVDFEIIENAKVGDIITPDKGYSYFAFENSVGAYTGGEKSLLYIAKFPQGAKISRCTAHCDDGLGGEIVTPRNARYKLLEKTIDKKGNITAYIEYIVEEPPKPAKINEKLKQEWLENI